MAAAVDRLDAHREREAEIEKNGPPRGNRPYRHNALRGATTTQAAGRTTY